MKDAHSENETEFLTTVDNADLPDVATTTATENQRRRENSAQQVVAAIASSSIGIIVAGGLCPLVIQVFVILTSWLSNRGSNIDVNGLLWMVSSAVFSLIATVVAVTFSGMLTIVFNWSFGKVFSPRVAVSLTGGLAGFLVYIPFWMGAFEEQIPLAVAVAIFLAFHGAGARRWYPLGSNDGPRIAEKM